MTTMLSANISYFFYPTAKAFREHRPNTPQVYLPVCAMIKTSMLNNQ